MIYIINVIMRQLIANRVTEISLGSLVEKESYHVHCQQPCLLLLMFDCGVLYYYLSQSTHLHLDWLPKRLRSLGIPRI